MLHFACFQTWIEAVFDLISFRAALEHADARLSMKHGLVRLDNVWGVGGGMRPVKYLINQVRLLAFNTDKKLDANYYFLIIKKGNFGVIKLLKDKNYLGM